MKPSDSGAVPRRVILIQLAILASLAAFYGLYLPFREKSRAAAEAEERELRIESLYQSLVVEDASPAGGGMEVPGAGPAPYGARAGGKTRAHPQRLNRTPSVGEVVQALGLPDRRATDFRSGLHLTWTGTEHSLEASFDQGRLYCLRREDRRTGHGALVFESSFAWHPF
jgi:hypothetical protein